MPRSIAPQNTKKPYTLGFNGHARSCDCAACAKSRAERVAELWEKNGAYARPKSDDATVFVNSYFRTQKNHFKRMPNSRNALRALVDEILKRKIKKGK